MLRLGPQALSDVEVLALVLGTGRSGQNVLVSAQVLLERAGGFAGLLALSPGQLQRFSGVGVATAGRLVAAAEMWRRASESPIAGQLQDSSAIAVAVLPQLMYRSDERFLVVVADRGLRLREVVVLREGGEHRVDIEVTEVLRVVLSRGGAAFAVAHNHPGGGLHPSAADAAITTQLRAAAAAVKLRFLDHLIVAGSEWTSIA